MRLYGSTVSYEELSRVSVFFAFEVYGFIA